MKEELVKLAKSKGFVQDFTAMQVSYSHIDIGYLWLCELQKWLRDEHKMHIYDIPFGENKGWVVSNIRLFHTDELIGKNTGLDEKDIYDSYEEALERGCLEALKLIKG